MEETNYNEYQRHQTERTICKVQVSINTKIITFGFCIALYLIHSTDTITSGSNDIPNMMTKQVNLIL